MRAASWYCSLGETRSRHGAEKDARTAGLVGVDVEEDGAEDALVDFDGFRARSPADRAAGIVELDGSIHFPGFAVVARDDEVDFLAADAGTDDLRGENESVLESDQLVPPTL